MVPWCWATNWNKIFKFAFASWPAEFCGSLSSIIKPNESWRSMAAYSAAWVRSCWSARCSACCWENSCQDWIHRGGCNVRSSWKSHELGNSQYQGTYYCESSRVRRQTGDAGGFWIPQLLSKNHGIQYAVRHCETHSLIDHAGISSRSRWMTLPIFLIAIRPIKDCRGQHPTSNQ